MCQVRDNSLPRQAAHASASHASHRESGPFGPSIELSLLDPPTPITDTDPELWEFVRTGADQAQMLFAQPLTAEQMGKL